MSLDGHRVSIRTWSDRNVHVEVAMAMATAEEGGKSKAAKGKAPPRLPKPDRPGFEARVAEIQAQCDAAQAQIDAIKTRIEAKKNGRRIDEEGAKPTKNKLQEVRDQFKAVLVRGTEGRGRIQTHGKPPGNRADARANACNRARKTQKRTDWPPWKRKEKACAEKSRRSRTSCPSPPLKRCDVRRQETPKWNRGTSRG